MCSPSQDLVKRVTGDSSRGTREGLGGHLTMTWSTTEPRQPWLHDLEISVHGNLSALVDRSGDMGGHASGLYADDRRVVSHATLTCDGEAPTPVSCGSVGPHTEIVAVARNLGDPAPDPSVEVRRVRTLRDGGLDERVTLTSRASVAVRTEVALTLAGDGADLADAEGRCARRAPLPATPIAGGVAWTRRAARDRGALLPRHGDGRARGRRPRGLAGRPRARGVRHAPAARRRTPHGSDRVRRRSRGRPAGLVGRPRARSGHAAST